MPENQKVGLITGSELSTPLETIRPAKIVTIQGLHAVNEIQAMKWDWNWWSPEVRTQVEKSDPDVIVGDSMNVGTSPFFDTVPYTEKSMVERLTKQPSRKLKLICADCTTLGAALFPEEYEALVRDRLPQDSDNNTYATSFFPRAKEEFSMDGLGILAGIVTISAITKMYLDSKVSRRSFLKGAAVGLGLGAAVATGIEVGRGVLLDSVINMFNTNSSIEINNQLKVIAQAIGPKWIRDSLVEIRNLKLGLAARAFCDDRTEFPVGGAKATIVLGNMHSFGTDPSSSREVLLDNLETILRRTGTFLSAAPSVRGIESVKMVLLKYLAEYDVWNMQMEGGELSVSQNPSTDSGRRITEVENMINKYFI